MNVFTAKIIIISLLLFMMLAVYFSVPKVCRDASLYQTTPKECLKETKQLIIFTASVALFGAIVTIFPEGEKNETNRI